jgi:N-acetylglutamate synthase-like GNAT family acetyltransferase
MSGEIGIRRELRPGDLGAIVAFHGRVYGPEYGVDHRFEAFVASSVAEAGKRGFPGEREAVWIVERDGELAGCLGLTDDGDAGVVRWFVFHPSVRGRGLGRRLIEELLDTARELGYERVHLETFSELRTAAHLYRSVGFELLDEDTAPRWGRDAITFQRYELDLGPGNGAEARAGREKHPVAGSA